MFCVNKKRKEKESGRKKDFSAKRIFLPKNKTLRGKIKKFVVGREKRTRKRKESCLFWRNQGKVAMQIFKERGRTGNYSLHGKSSIRKEEKV